MPRTREPRIYAATEAFSVIEDGAPINFNRGDLVEEGDPILDTHRDKFDKPRVRHYSGRVEQATAAPGERRGG